jgi:[acyl-carrier-protein] S-malonyltransferase
VTAQVDQLTTTEPALLTWSAPDELAESRLREGIARTLETADPAGVTQLATRLAQRCDPAHPVRSALVVTDPARAVTDLAGGREAPVRRIGERTPRPVALLLDGHGAQHVRMGAQLYRADPVFTAAMDEFFAASGDSGDALRTAWLSTEPGASLDAAELGQPLLFALGHALGQVVLGWGIRPVALIGHSVGELAAAAIAGVFTPAAVAGLMEARIAGYAEAVPGGVLAVAATREELQEYLGDGVAIGVVNGPKQTMLAGPEPALSRVEERLRAAGRTCVRARIPLPFHSPVLAPLADKSERALAGIPLRAPEIDVYSTRTARPLTAEQARDPRFWAMQVCDPVLFAPALDALLSDRDVLLVEAGPGRSLANLARQHDAVAGGRSAVAAMLPPRLGGPGADRAAVLSAAAAIWLEGHDPVLDAGSPAGVAGGGAHPPRR